MIWLTGQELLMKLKTDWTKLAETKLLGKQITRVEYMTAEEAERFGWDYRPLCLQLDEELWIWALRDDECNDAGAVMYVTWDEEEDHIVFPVVHNADKIVEEQNGSSNNGTE
tara:strand:+ start:108 stop:443 length:336 start_codon:yes stop_codon:yes gene_type:complete